jgi:hypothetical protein
MDRVQDSEGAPPAADDCDIARAAELLFQQYGTLAAVRARALADTLRAKGDEASAATWHRIAEAIATLRPPTKRPRDSG